MKSLKLSVLTVSISAGILLSGCQAVQNTNHTQRGAATGAAAGAIIGGILGNNVKGGNTATGAIAGAVIGGVAGGLIGNKMDKQAEKIETTLPGAEVIRTAEGIQVILDENSDVKFEYNKSDLTAASKTNLDKLIGIFQEYPDTDLLVLGHTDSIGSAAFNQTLSEKRSGSVVSYLASKGIPSSRLTSKGMGKSDPIASNDTPEGRAKNRRVEFVITANEKMVEEAQQQAGE